MIWIIYILIYLENEAASKLYMAQDMLTFIEKKKINAWTLRTMTKTVQQHI